MQRIVSEDIIKDIVAMVIDDKRKHVLTKLLKTKNGIVKKESDHYTNVTEIKLKWKCEEKSTKTELFILKNKDCQKSFTSEMNYTEELS